MSARLEREDEARARLEREGLTAQEQAALWRRIDESVAGRRPGARRGRAIGLGLALAAAALAGVLLLAPRWFAPPTERARAPAVVDRCALSESGGATAFELPPGCPERQVEVDGDLWSLAADTEVARTPQGARVVRGKVRFRVRKRTASQFRVRVSHGEVRVIGTVFVIEQRSARGSITVTEGVVEFVWQDGTHERVAAGQTLHWPREKPPPAPALATDAGVGRSHADKAAPDLEHVVDRLLQLRSQKRWPEAVGLLRETLARPGLRRVERARISYELGLALESAGEPSCAHWRRHLERFGRGDHGPALDERMQHCGP